MSLDLETIKKQATTDIMLRWKGGYPSQTVRLVDRIEELEGLLESAYTRLMVSEGDARYENANIELAKEIEAKLGREL